MKNMVKQEPKLTENRYGSIKPDNQTAAPWWPDQYTIEAYMWYIMVGLNTVASKVKLNFIETENVQYIYKPHT